MLIVSGIPCLLYFSDTTDVNGGCVGFICFNFGLYNFRALILTITSKVSSSTNKKVKIIEHEVDIQSVYHSRLQCLINNKWFYITNIINKQTRPLPKTTGKDKRHFDIFSLKVRYTNYAFRPGALGQ